MEAPAQADQEFGTPRAQANPHVLWRQTLGFVFWTLLLSLHEGPVSAAWALALGGSTFADGWISGIYKIPGRKAFLNISPMAWGIVMVGFFGVSYPAYLLNRGKLRTRRRTDAYFILTIVLGGIWFLLVLIDSLGATFGYQMIQTLVQTALGSSR
jgi:hypothetical protein